MNEGSTIAGLDAETYNTLASQHSKNSIFLWLLGGTAYVVWSGSFLSLATALLFIPGIFIASLLSMLAFLINLKKRRSLIAIHGWSSGPLALLKLAGWSLWSLIDFALPLAAAVGFVEVVRAAQESLF